MIEFTALAASTMKYADYKVIFKDSDYPCSIATSVVETPIRVYVRAYRVPSTKTFAVYIRSNATPQERAAALRWGIRLPVGSWAEVHAAAWFRTKLGDRIAFYQSLGHPVADPLLELEIAEFLESDIGMDFDLSTSNGVLA